MSATASLLSGSGIYSGAFTDTSASQSTDRLATDKFTFLKLLVAQLTNQDPLDPADDKEFVAQLAQFTSLEQLQEINTGVGTLNETMNQGQLMSATSFIGKAVVVSGDQVTKVTTSDGNVATTVVYYSFDEPIEKAYVTITDGTNIIRQDTVGSLQAGTYQYTWNGLKDNGAEASTGVYKIIIAAVDGDDKTVPVTTQFTAQVTSVYAEGGVYYLSLDGGRTVALTDVVEIGEGVTTTTSTSTATYAKQAADMAAKASLAADSAALHEAAIGSDTDGQNAKKAADAAIAAAETARAAADAAEAHMAEARKAAEAAQTAEALEEYALAKEWTEKAAAYADAAETSADNAKVKALAIDPSLEFAA